MKKTLGMVSLIFVMTMLLVAHGNAEAASPRASATLGTASSAGAFYAIGAGMVGAINENSEFLTLIVQATHGGAENMELVHSREMELAFSTTYHGFSSFYDTDLNADQGKKDILGVMALHASSYQMLVRSTANVTTFADLKGLRVCLGSTVPEIVIISKAIVTAHGVDPENDITPFYMSQDDGAQRLADGDIDASVIMTGVPAALFSNLTIDDRFHLVDGDPAVLAEITSSGGEIDFVSAGVIRAGTYNNDRDINTVFARALIFTHPDMEEDVIYEFCKQVYENFDAIKMSHSVLEPVDRDTIGETVIPLHPGAERYYREIGIIN